MDGMIAMFEKRRSEWAPRAASVTVLNKSSPGGGAGGAKWSSPGGGRSPGRSPGPYADVTAKDGDFFNYLAGGSLRTSTPTTLDRVLGHFAHTTPAVLGIRVGLLSSSGFMSGGHFVHTIWTDSPIRLAPRPTANRIHVDRLSGLNRAGLRHATITYRVLILNDPGAWSSFRSKRSSCGSTWTPLVSVREGSVSG